MKSTFCTSSEVGLFKIYKPYVAVFSDYTDQIKTLCKKVYL